MTELQRCCLRQTTWLRHFHVYIHFHHFHCCIHVHRIRSMETNQFRQNSMPVVLRLSSYNCFFLLDRYIHIRPFLYIHVHVHVHSMSIPMSIHVSIDWLSVRRRTRRSSLSAATFCSLPVMMRAASRQQRCHCPIAIVSRDVVVSSCPLLSNMFWDVHMYFGSILEYRNLVYLLLCFGGGGHHLESILY